MGSYANCDYETAKTMNIRDLLVKDPALTALHFNRRFDDKDFLPNVTLPENEDNTLAYIVNIISTQIPSKDSNPELHQLVKKVQLHQLVKKVQVHYHSPNCQGFDDKRKSCRFHFPLKACEQTRLISTPDIKTHHLFYETKRSHEHVKINMSMHTAQRFLNFGEATWTLNL